jgi:hypothetical protein
LQKAGRKKTKRTNSPKISSGPIRERLSGKNPSDLGVLLSAEKVHIHRVKYVIHFGTEDIVVVKTEPVQVAWKLAGAELDAIGRPRQKALQRDVQVVSMRSLPCLQR